MFNFHEYTGRYVHGKFLATMVQLLDEEEWDTRRFHLWYMEPAKAGMSGFSIKIPPKYFNLPDGETMRLFVEFSEMHSLLQGKDLDIVPVTIFSL